MDFVGSNGVGENQRWVSKVSEPKHKYIRLDVSPQNNSKGIEKDGLKAFFDHRPRPGSEYVCPVCFGTHIRFSEWEIKFNDLNSLIFFFISESWKFFC